MTPFALLCDRCGLSHREAAEFLGVRLDTVRSWSSGRNGTPAGVVDELRAISRLIEAAAEKAVATAEALIEDSDPPPDAIELGIASTDEEARALGLPCVGAHRAYVGMVAARLKLPVRIVPRGSTAATQAAAKAHGR